MSSLIRNSGAVWCSSELQPRGYSLTSELWAIDSSLVTIICLFTGVYLLSDLLSPFLYTPFYIVVVMSSCSFEWLLQNKISCVAQCLGTTTKVTYLF